MSDGVVATRQGKIRGSDEGGVWSFRGIHYAAPTAGSSRWCPPRAPESWSGVRDASEFGPIAPQPRDGIGSYFPGDPQEQSEDCCSLNIWSPDPLGRGPSLPVLVFIHGGAFITGSGSGVMYRGTKLARRGAVVVTINYRLGALGFLAHPCLAEDESGGFGNWGLADQLAALAWVRDNIGGFGGDPGNVTVFGESAGAMSVAGLLGRESSPRRVARGVGGSAGRAPGGPLFRRAVLQSGAPLATSPPAASRVAEQLGAGLGLARLSREALSTVPLDELLAAQRTIVASVDEGVGLPFQPVVDGGLLARHPADVIAAGASASTDVLIGTNRDEFKVFAYALRGLDALDEAKVASIVARYLRGSGLTGERAEAWSVLECYREARLARGEGAGPRELLESVATDWLFRIPALRLASAHAGVGGRVFSYRFDWESPFLGGVLGACHGIELPFVFGTFEDQFVGLFAGTGADASALSEAVQAAWVAFARTGSPACEELGDWPAYDQRARATMVLGPDRHLEDAPGEQERRFWEDRLGRFGVSGPIEGALPGGVALLAPDGGEEISGT